MPTSYTAAPWMTASQPSMPARIASRVGEVARDQLAAELRRAASPFSGLRTRHDDLVAALAQLAHDLAADEAGASGDEDLHGAKPIRPGTGAYNRDWSAAIRETAATTETRYARRERRRRLEPARAPAGAGDRRRRRRASDGDPLAELKELLRTAGVATAGEVDPAARRSPTPTATSAAASWPS